MGNYYSDGMCQFANIRSLRSRVFLNLMETQTQFIKFLDRKSGMQKKLNDFCESYNRFASEYPHLMKNDETRDELLNRLNMLSQQFWEIIKQRKDEALQERNNQMEGGWVQIEMANLTSAVARLVELEFSRFSTNCALLTGVVINEEVNL